MLAALGGFFSRKTKEVAAVDGIGFDVASGRSRPGFLGPNGAGKTTALKMMSGLLNPTSGDVRVLGHIPCKREKAYLRQITLVMGQRNQLVWDIPAIDSFELNRAIYRIPDADFRRTSTELIELLEIGELIKKPVRTLSLGERMKCEIAAALLHQPQGAVSRRADDQPGCHDAAAHPALRRAVQQAPRINGATDQPLHGRRRGAL